MSQSDATSALIAAGLKVDGSSVKQTTDSVTAGDVLGVVIDGEAKSTGELVSLGSTVTLVIAEASETTPTEQPTPTPTETPTADTGAASGTGSGNANGTASGNTGSDDENSETTSQ